LLAANDKIYEIGKGAERYLISCDKHKYIIAQIPVLFKELKPFEG
jgi:hypothetical protein